MSPASHMVGRLRKLYGIVWNWMRFLNARQLNPLCGRSQFPHSHGFEPLEPRLLLSGNLLLNPGAESGVGIQPGTVNDWTAGGDSNPGRDDGSFDPGINPHSGGFDFYGGHGAVGTLSQTMNLSADGITAAQIDGGGLFADVEFFEQSLSQGAAGDAASVQITFLSASNAALGGGYDSGLIYNVGQWQDVTGQAAIPVGTRSIEYTMTFTRRAGGDNNAFIDDNALSVWGAVPIPSLYPTGVDNSSGLLPGGSSDPHYTADGHSAYVLSSGNLWPQWPQPATGEWINYEDSWDTTGTHVFSTTFDLTGLAPNTAQISGVWTSDNAGRMYLNGNFVNSLGGSDYSSLHDFSVTSGFQPGVNTLTFSVDMDTFDGLLISEISGTADLSGTPALQLPSAAVSTPSGTQSGNVAIGYTLADPASNPVNIAVQYSTDGGATWNTATAAAGGDGTTNLTASPGGVAHTFDWASGTDLLDSNNPNVLVMVTPTEAGATGSGTAGISKGFVVNNYQPPAVSISIPISPQSGDALIGYTLQDAGSNPMGITVQYSTDGGGTWNTATSAAGNEGTTNLASSPTGVAHDFLWSSSTDLANSNADVEVRITPSDSGGTGAISVSRPFTVLLDGTYGTAAYVGAGPGVHMDGLAIDQAWQTAWYSFQVLRADSIEISSQYGSAAGTLNLQLQSSNGTRTWSAVQNAGGLALTVNNLASGTYYMEVSGVLSGDSPLVYSLGIDPAAGSGTTVYYVNSPTATNDYYTLAPGNDSNSGLDPMHPKATIQSLLASYTLGPDALVVIDTGDYATGTITLSGAIGDQGAAYAGSPGGSDFSYGGNRWELNDSSYNLFYGLDITGYGGTGFWEHPSNVPASSTNNTFMDDTFTGSDTAIYIQGGASDVIQGNVINGNGSSGIVINGGSQEVIEGNTILDRSTAIYVNSAPGTQVEDNDLLGGNPNDAGRQADTGIYVVNGNSSGSVSGNTVTGYTGTGIYVNDGSAIYDNTVYGNGTGICAWSTIGGANWSAGQPNDVYDNGIGIQAEGGAEVRFNLVHGNTVGILVDYASSVTIDHNLIYRNTGQGILAHNSSLSILNNTIYTPSGDGVRIDTSSSNELLKNNIIWTDSGYDIYVATDSQTGFASDYNNLFTTGTGTLVWFQKPFTDLFDWQVESNYDGHSIGYTVPDGVPNLQDNPQFVDLADDNYHLTDVVSTSIAAGDPSSPFNLQPGPYPGDHIELGAYGDTAQAAQAPSSYIKIDYPNYYTDWEANTGHAILWHTYNVPANGIVDITVVDATTGSLVASIANVQAGIGSYGWSPSASGLGGNVTSRYRIILTYAGEAGVTAESREGFSVPPSGNSFYINDGSTAGDQYTTAVGSNRNTGKTPGDPKANLLPMLGSYNLGPLQTVYIDTGTYINVRNVVISGNPALGSGQGAAYIGPTIPGDQAVFNRDNTNNGCTNIEVNAGNYVTIENLVLTGAQTGLWVHNASTHFTGINLTVENNSQNGLVAESDTTDAVLDYLTAHDNGAAGIYITAPISRLSNSIAYNNNTGISVSISVSGAPTVIGSADSNGNPDLALGNGDQVYNNRSDGVDASGNVLVMGDKVFGNSGTGIFVVGAMASNNVVYGNYDGIVGRNNSIVSGNRVFANAEAGILCGDTPTITGNIAYSNSVGIMAGKDNWDGFNGLIANNLVYANTNEGVLVSGSNGVQLTNNTIYQPMGDAVRLQRCWWGGCSNVHLENNILWVQAGYDINVAPDSEVGFESDYNDLYTTDTGQIALWEGVSQPGLADWQDTAGTDHESISQDPLFVNPSSNDFHEQSLNGSFHGGSLAPIINQATGLPEPNPGVLTPDANESPAIDRGDAASTFVNEPVPNGGFVNVGAYGNTPQASLSPVDYVLPMTPAGGAVWPEGLSFDISWRSESPGTYDVDLLEGGNPTPVLSIASGVLITTNEGDYAWNIPTSLTPGNEYYIQIVRTDTGASAISAAPFSIAAPVYDFYVNDGSTAGDQYTTAPGSDAASGLDPAHPKASIQALLAAYPLGAGDTIYVDNGTYDLSSNIVLTAADSGLSIVGPTDPGTAAVLNRGNGNGGAYVIDLSGANDVTLENLSVTGANDGIYAVSSATGLTIMDSGLYGNSDNGIYVDGSSSGLTLTDSSVYGNGGTGVYISGPIATVSGDTIYDNGLNGGHGIEAYGWGEMIIDNNVYGNHDEGIVVSNGDWTAGHQSVVMGNTVDNNLWGGWNNWPGASNEIYAIYDVWVTGNTVYGSGGGTGISVYGGGTVSQNVVYGNYDGIVGRNNSIVSGNRVFANAEAGILCGDTPTITGNIVYSNSVGIMAGYDNWGGFSGLIANNLVYANTNEGVLVSGSNGVQLANNTIYQPVGDAVRLQRCWWGGSSNVHLENNILWVQAGYDINVAPDSEVGFESDYNDLYTTDTGQIALWEGQGFTNLADWFYEVGFDGHSTTAAPQFIDPAGADGILGYSTALTGTPQYVDDASAVLTGTWTSQAGGYGGSYLLPNNWQNTATWTITGLVPGQAYQVAVAWPAGGNLAGDTSYAIGDSSAPLTTIHLDQRNAPSDFMDGGVGWKILGTFRPNGTTLSVEVWSNWGGSPVAADAVRVQELQGDCGADDDLHVASTSPTIDAGDPDSPYLNEPQPNGGRINIGADGNTAQANPSPVQELQMLSPNSGLEKYQQGQGVTVQWQSFGLTQSNTVFLMNAGGGAVDNWSANAYQTVSGNTNSTSNFIDTSGVTDPAPQAVYQSCAYANGGAGNELAYSLPIPDGTYTITLEFADEWTNGPGERVFDVKLNGTTVQSDYDIYAAAGNNATALSFAVTASGGQGIHLELVNDPDNWNAGAILSGIELTQANPAGVANPTVDLQVSGDNGATWNTIATGLSMDGYGRGSYNWTVPADQPPGQYLMRVVSDDVAGLTGTSAGTFQIANGGTSFYVNDGSTAGDQYTTAVGNNANDGKTPGTPMASLAALIDVYHPGAGDTIYVDNGTYDLSSNIVLTAADSGLSIVGPTDPGTAAVLNRGNGNGGAYVIDLSGANDVTLENLSVTGANDGIYAVSSATGLTIMDSGLYGNSDNGIYVDGSSSGLTLTDSSVYGNGGTGVYISGPIATVSGDTIYDNGLNGGHGIEAYGWGEMIIDNNVYGNHDEGIVVSNGDWTAGHQSVVMGNTVDNNLWGGWNNWPGASNEIYAIYDVWVTGNTVYGSGGGTGISVYGGGTVSQNVVYGNYDGIVGRNNSIVSGNRVFANAEAGILCGDTPTITGNIVYSNSVGIMAGYDNWGGFSGLIANNLVYANTNEGVLVSGSNGVQLANNTIYQPVGDAVRLQRCWWGGSSNVHLENNILWVQAGYDINVAPDSEVGFTSDWNLFYKSTDPNAYIGYWNGTQDTLAAWQAATGQGADSLLDNPKFVNMAGADNVLGYDFRTGYDGGLDDNFYLSADSPAIDRGNSWAAPPTDITGAGRWDDPGTPNAGSPDFQQNTDSSSLFIAGGTAMNWQGYNTFWNLALPFAFSFYGTTYTSVSVSSSGFLEFSGPQWPGDSSNSTSKLLSSAIIAPMWGNFSTNAPGDDIYVDTSVANQVTIRWAATNQVDSSQANFDVVLFANGTIRFDYGSGNADITPTVGISMGDGQHYVLAAYNGSGNLAGANSLEFDLIPGYADIGAYEYQGNSANTTPPAIVSASPAVIGNNGSAAQTVRQVTLTFSEPLNPIDANAPANYDLRSPGPDGILGTADDIVYSLTPQYTPGSTVVILTIDGGDLPDGVYQLTVYGDLSRGIHDLSGNLMNGDWVRTFSLVPLSPSVPQLSPSCHGGLSNMTDVNTPTFTGTATPGYTVTICSDGLAVGSGLAAPNGSYSITTAVLTDGVHAITATATDSQGINSLPSDAQVVTIDTIPPTSSVQALPAYESGSFTVSWSGADNVGGSGLAGYSIYVSDNGGPFTAWLTGTTATSATFTGVNGHTYGFYSIAADNVGNVEEALSVPQATTTVQAQPPTVVVTTPIGRQEGNVAINYTLTDTDSNPCSIQVQYSIDGGSTWETAAPGSGGDGTTSLTSSPGGTPHTFVWNSDVPGTDLYDVQNTNVQFRVIPSFASGAGNAAATGSFTVDNILGDVNRDGLVNAADIDAIYQHFGAPASSQWKVDGDGTPVGQGDVDYLLKSILHRSYGDANLDGKVDFVDFQVLLDHWQMSGQGWAKGDFNGDGKTDFLDFQKLLDNWNPAGTGGTAMATVASQPLLAAVNQTTAASVSVSAVPAISGSLSSSSSLMQAGTMLTPAPSDLNSQSIQVEDLLATGSTSNASVHVPTVKATVLSRRSSLTDGSWISDNDTVDLLTQLIKPVVA